MKKILLLCFSVFLSGCELLEKGHRYITVVNNSDEDIYVDKSYNYPDTIFHHDWIALSYNEYDTKVKSRSSSDRALSLFVGNSWENIFAYGDIESDTLMVFILNVDSIELWERNDYSKECYLPNDAVLKRYDFSLNDLKRINWTITYP